MDTFDNFKNQIAEAQEFFASFIQNASFPSEKKESRLFTAQEATVIMNEFINILASATEDKDQFIRRVGIQEISGMSSAISHMLTVGENGEFDSFVTQVEKLIPSIRTVNESFRKSSDNARYQQIVNMEKTLSEMNQQKRGIDKISRTMNLRVTQIDEAHNKVANKITELEGQNTQSQTLLSDFNDHLKNAKQHEETIKDLLEQSNNHLPSIKEAVTLAQQQKEAIGSRDAEANEYREKMNALATRHETTINNHQKENEEGRKETQDSLKEAKNLITQAEYALQTGIGAGLSDVFIARRDRAAEFWPKCFWIVLLLSFSGCAIYVGHETITSQSDISESFVLARTLILFIAMAVAGFAAKQYAKNKTIEEDYSYKSALVGSFPGFIKELNKSSPEHRDTYVNKLLNELLQDPQRDRSQNNELLQGLQRDRSQNNANLTNDLPETPLPKNPGD